MSQQSHTRRAWLYIAMIGTVLSFVGYLALT